MKIKCDTVNGCDYLTAGKEYTVLDEHPRYTTLGEHPRSYSNPEQRYLDILTDTGLRITVLLKDCPHIQANWRVVARENEWSNWIKNNQKDPNINNIEVRFRDGDRDFGDSKEYYWGIDSEDCDIMTYRYNIQERAMQSMAEEMTAVSAELSSYMTKEEEELFKEEEYDMVDRPKHYALLPGVEVKDVRRAILDKLPEGVPYTQVDDWSRCWEYITRMWDKNGLEDAKKARVYLDWLIEKMENDEQSVGE